MRPVQYFTDEYLEHCQKMTPTQIVDFLEDFRLMLQDEGKSRLISIKVPENLLNNFKATSEMSGVKYQTQIKNLMREWLHGK